MNKQTVVKFGTLNENGTISETREINMANIRACPHIILAFEHYRANGSCRCDDPDHTEMDQWGYTWNGKAWV